MIFSKRTRRPRCARSSSSGRGLRPSREQIESGLARTVIPGRMEFFPSHPGVVFDIAHNPDKAAHLAHALAETFPDRRFTFVMAIGESKDAAQVIEPFLALKGSFTFTTFSVAGRNASRPQRLASITNELGGWGRAITDPVEAFSIARRNADARRRHRRHRLDVHRGRAARMVDGERSVPLECLTR